MASSEPQGLRRRTQDIEKPSEVPANGPQDELLDPDYVFVFAETSKPEATKALAAISDAGYFVKFRKGASGTILLLVRAGPGLVAGVKSRAFTVEQTVSAVKLPGVIDSFPVQPRNLPSTLEPNVRGVFSPRLGLTDDQLDAIEGIYGGYTASVFELGNFMLRALLYLAIVAVPTFYLFGGYTAPFCIALLVWGTLFVAYWRNYVERSNKTQRAEKALQPAPLRLAGYKGKPASSVELRKLLFIPFASGLLIFYALGLFAVLCLEIFCTQLYAGPLPQIVKLVPVGANVVVSQIYGIIYTFAVNKFTEWEDYSSKQALEQTRAQRQFYLQALLGFTPILLTAYVYLPFGHLLIDALSQLRRSKVGYHVKLVPKFKLNQDRLFSQTLFYTLQTQIIGLVMTAVVPPAVYAFKRYVLHKADAAGNNRFSLQQLRLPFDPSMHLQNVVLSFGYVMILAPVWPLACLTTFVGLYLRSKFAAYTLLRATRKPTLHGQSRAIGFWSDELQLLLILSSLVAPSITFMYGKSSTYYDRKTSLVDVTWSAVLLAAFVAENATLILLHVASKVYETLDLPTLPFTGAAAASSTEKPVVAPIIDEQQDSLWRSTDIEQEIRAVFAPAVPQVTTKS